MAGFRVLIGFHKVVFIRWIQSFGEANGLRLREVSTYLNINSLFSFFDFIRMTFWQEEEKSTSKLFQKTPLPSAH